MAEKRINSITESKTEDNNAYTLDLTRILNAPRKKVFKAWTDRVQLAKWWGPKGFTNPRCEIDVKPGGAIRIDMKAPDGVIYPMSGAYREIVEPERLVFTSAALDKNNKPIFEVLNIVTFGEQGGRTILIMHASVTHETPEAAQYLKGMEEGWNLSIDRLEAFVEKN
ncbi:MAG: SRPBCC domain-containing protein [Bacteroidota bacterium]